MYATLDPANTPCQGSYSSITAVQFFDIRIDRVKEYVSCVVLVSIDYLGYDDMGLIIRQLQVRYGRRKVKKHMRCPSLLVMERETSIYTCAWSQCSFAR